MLSSILYTGYLFQSLDEVSVIGGRGVLIELFLHDLQSPRVFPSAHGLVGGGLGLFSLFTWLDILGLIFLLLLLLLELFEAFLYELMIVLRVGILRVELQA